MNAMTYISLLRPRQWLKNVLLFFPPFFSGKIAISFFWGSAWAPLLAFSLGASSCYLLNDIKDKDVDKKHFRKKDRAIARGDVKSSFAVVLAIVLYVAAMLVASSVSERFMGFLVFYLLGSALYTFFFKQVMLADIFFISILFLIRLMAGGEAFHVPISSWLFLTVFMVSLVLASGKRLGELVALGEEAHKHRKALSQYSIPFLEGIIWFFASAALVMYAIYAVERHNNLFYTVPLAAYGFVRYIYIVKKGKGDPTDALLKDWQIMGIGIAWAVSIGIITYG